MSRLPYPDFDQLPEPTAAALAAFPVPVNIVKLSAHASTLLPGLLDMAKALLTSLELRPRWREMLILLVAHHTGCHYEWEQHLPQAAGAGVTAEDLKLITDESRVSTDSTERLLLAFARTCLADGPWDDADVAEAAQHFSAREIVELLYVVGFVRMCTGVINCLAPDIDDAQAARAAHRARFTSSVPHDSGTSAGQAKSEEKS